MLCFDDRIKLCLAFDTIFSCLKYLRSKTLNLLDLLMLFVD